MSEDEIRARKAAAQSFRFMAAPMVFASVFTCVRAPTNGGWKYYIVLFLIGMLFPLASILLKNPHSSEPDTTGTDLSWRKDLPFYLMNSGLYFIVEFAIIVPFLDTPFVKDMFYRIGPLDVLLLLLLIVLTQTGMLVFAADLKHLFPVRRLHRSVYNHENWIRYAKTNIFTDAIASTYCMPRGEYQEIGIVLIWRWRKKDCGSEECFYHGRRPVLFAPLFLVRSASTIRPPDILYDPEREGVIDLQFLGDGAAQVEHSYENRSFNRDTYTIRLRKFLQVPSGWLESQPRGVFPGRLCPVLVPEK